MAGRYDPNPFDTDDAINPFSNHRNVHAVSSNSRLPTLAPEPAVDIPLGSAESLKKKKKELQAKEAELNKREEILRRKEEALAKAGVEIQERNWPPFYPVIHHDISGEIPIYLQRLQYVALATLLGVPITLLWNLIANAAGWIGNATDGKYFFLAIIYLVLGPPGAYYFWYRSIYRALRTDNGTSFGCFFFNYLYHIVFFIFAAIGPPIIFNGLCFAGIMTAISILPDHPGVAIFYFIGFALFTVEATVSIWVYQQVYRHFRGGSRIAGSQRGALSHAL